MAFLPDERQKKKKKKKKKSNFNSYTCSYTLFLDHFYAQIVVVRWNICKLRSSEKSLTNVFDHYVKKPSSWFELIERYVDQMRRLFIRDVA